VPDLENFDRMTIREILVALIGEEKADILLKTIIQGIKDGKQGEEHYKLIYETLCRLSVTNTQVIFFLQVIPHVNPHVNPETNF
jgi:hypothetical protein